MNFVLTCIQIYFVCYAFGQSEYREDSVACPETKLAKSTCGNREGDVSLTRLQSKMPKSTCGIRTGGPIVQQLTEAIFAYPTGLFWLDSKLVFVDYYGPECCCYRPFDDGETFKSNITELSQTSLHAMLPLMGEKMSYLLVAEKSLYKAVFKGEGKDITWTITDVMEVFENTNWNMTRPHASASHKLWAACNTASLDAGQVIMVDILKNQTTVNDYKYKDTIGLAWNKNQSIMYTISSTTIYHTKFDPDTDTASETEVLLEFQDFKDKIQGELHCITVDVDGNLWLCVTGPGMVIQIDIEIKDIIQMISVPGTTVTNAQFGGKHFEKLIVAVAKDQLPGSRPGALFAISAMGARGFAPNWIDLRK